MAFEVEINGQRAWYIGISASKVLWVAWHEREIESVQAAYTKALAYAPRPSARVELAELAKQGVCFVNTTRRAFIESRKAGGEQCQV